MDSHPYHPTGSRRVNEIAIELAAISGPICSRCIETLAITDLRLWRPSACFDWILTCAVHCFGPGNWSRRRPSLWVVLALRTPSTWQGWKVSIIVCKFLPGVWNGDPFSQFGRTYEACQWSPSSYNGQTTRCVAVVEKHKGDLAKGDEVESHLARFDFYATTKSRYYAPVAVGIWCTDWELGCDALEIGGHFAVLSDEQRGVHDDGARRETPKYDVSWILDAAT